MNALMPAFCAASAIVFATIARETAKSHGLRVSLRRATAVVPTLVAAVSTTWMNTAGADGYAQATVLACAAVSAATDIQTGYVFDRVVLVALAILLGLSIESKALSISVTGAALTGGPLFVIHVMSRGRGIGLGDVKLGAIIGFGLGVTAGLEALRCAVLTAGCFGIVVLLCGRYRSQRWIRFAPFLAVGSAYAAIKCR